MTKALEIWAPQNAILKKMRDGVRDWDREVFLSMLDPNPEAQMLDVGCSIGDFTLEIAKRLGTSKVFGLDVKDYSPKGISFKVADLNEGLPYDGSSFDVITVSQVIEHLQDTERFLGEVYRVLKPGGYVVISTPNLAAWHNVMCLVLGKQPPVAALDKDHTRLLTVEGLLNLLHQRGLEVQKVVGVGWYPLPRPLAQILCLIDKGHVADVIVRAKRC